MTFLAPLFLLGALAVALPVLFHLIRRATRERTVFSSLLFLMPSPPRLTRRSRLEHILLLLFRCAVLCLLAAAFARPFIKKPISTDPTAGPSSRLIVLLDTSASMRRAHLWTDAREKAISILRKAGPSDQAAVFTFDRQLTPLVSFDQWKASPPGQRVALAAARMEEASPGWAGTHVGKALISAAEALADTALRLETGPRQIILITDFQEGSRLDQLQGYEWPKGVAVSVEIIKPIHPTNAGLQLATDPEDADPKAERPVRVRVTNSADSKRDQFKVGWSDPEGRGFLSRPQDVYVPAGQSRIISLAAIQPPARAAMADRILLQGDDEPFDNSLYVVPAETERLTILYLGADSSQDTHQPLYFLERAFSETLHQSVQVLARPPSTPLNTAEVQGASMLVMTDALPEERAAALHEQLVGGKAILFGLKDSTTGPTLARLLGLGSINVEEVHPNNYAMLAEMDLRHPLFAPFADPRFSDFTKIHFWKYRRLDPAAIPGARVVAKFDSGDPALLEIAVGKGRVFVLTSVWHPEDSQLALSTKFVPLLYSMLEQAGAKPPAAPQYSVGDTVPLAGPTTINPPEGPAVLLAAGTTNFTQTLVPGIYLISSNQPMKRFAVNLDSAESRTSPFPLDELERLGAPASTQTRSSSAMLAQKARLKNDELEARQKLWRYALLATLGLLFVETWLAGRTARKMLHQPEVASASSVV